MSSKSPGFIVIETTLTAAPRHVRTVISRDQIKLLLTSPLNLTDTSAEPQKAALNFKGFQIFFR